MAELFSFKFTHILRLDATPAMIRLVDRIVGGASNEQIERIAEAMETMRERLDALKQAVEADEARRAEIVRLQEERARMVAEEEIEDNEERIEDQSTAQMVSQWETERASLQQRIDELSAVPRNSLSDAEVAELDDYIRRMNAGPQPTPPPTPTE